MKARVLFAALAALLCFASCTKPSASAGGHIDLDSKGTTVTINFTASDSWNVFSDDHWLVFSPRSGSKGAVEMKVSASANKTTSKRLGTFVINDGDSKITYSVTQDNDDVILLPSETIKAPMEGSMTINVSSNVDFEVTSDQAWAVPTVTKASKDRVVTIALERNPSSEPRTATLTFKGERVETKATLVQDGWIEIDWTKAFSKRVLGFRFTGTWCGYCPCLGKDIEALVAERPKEFAYMSFYDESGSLTSASQSAYEKFYKISSFPTIILDNRGGFSNYNSSKSDNTNYVIISDFIKEAKTSYSPYCGLNLETSTKSGNVNVSGVVFSKEAFTGHVHVAVVESGLIASQTDNYNILPDKRNAVHNNVVRGYVTTFGEGVEFTVSANGYASFSIDGALPSNIVDKDNANIVVYVTRPAVSGTSSKVQYVTYRNYGEIVDNCVVCPLSGKVEVEYE